MSQYSRAYIEILRAYIEMSIAIACAGAVPLVSCPVAAWCLCLYVGGVPPHYIEGSPLYI